MCATEQRRLRMPSNACTNADDGGLGIDDSTVSPQRGLSRGNVAARISFVICSCVQWRMSTFGTNPMHMHADNVNPGINFSTRVPRNVAFGMVDERRIGLPMPACAKPTHAMHKLVDDGTPRSCSDSQMLPSDSFSCLAMRAWLHSVCRIRSYPSG